jgi:hypothetical protein
MSRYRGRAAALTGRVWLEFAVGKMAADIAWHGMKASPRRGVPWTVTAAQPATPYLLLDLARAQDSFAELAAALPGVAVHYAVKANPHPRLLACLHAAGCRFEAASWTEVRAAIRAGAAIAEYGFLSNCEQSCLVAPNGAVEWLCLPRPDSPSVFGRSSTGPLAPS